jgi:predicted membrane metal-binding protein
MGADRAIGTDGSGSRTSGRRRRSAAGLAEVLIAIGLLVLLIAGVVSIAAGKVLGAPWTPATPGGRLQ